MLFECLLGSSECFETTGYPSNQFILQGKQFWDYFACRWYQNCWFYFGWPWSILAAFCWRKCNHFSFTYIYRLFVYYRQQLKHQQQFPANPLSQTLFLDKPNKTTKQFVLLPVYSLNHQVTTSWILMKLPSLFTKKTHTSNPKLLLP